MISIILIYDMYKKNQDKNIKENSYEYENTNCLNPKELVEAWKSVIQNIYQNTINANN